MIPLAYVLLNETPMGELSRFHLTLPVGRPAEIPNCSALEPEPQRVGVEPRHCCGTFADTNFYALWTAEGSARGQAGRSPAEGVSGTVPVQGRGIRPLATWGVRVLRGRAGVRVVHAQAQARPRTGVHGSSPQLLGDDEQGEEE